MGCEVILAFNNNVILANEDGRQMVIISKGVGFGRHKGDKIDLEHIDPDKRIFHILEEGQAENDLRHGIEEMEKIAHEIVEIASVQLEIEDAGDKLFEALFDHISFSLERLKVGIPIENPFVFEISVLCRSEYSVAQTAARLIHERLGISIGEAEIGFIALHLYSARKRKPVKTAMKNMRIFNQALAIVAHSYNRDFCWEGLSSDSFFLSLSRYIYDASNGSHLEMPLKSQVFLQMGKAHRAALEIAAMLKEELSVELEEDMLAFLAVDIHKLIQA